MVDLATLVCVGILIIGVFLYCADKLLDLIEDLH
jgi:hypothetical protein